MSEIVLTQSISRRIYLFITVVHNNKPRDASMQSHSLTDAYNDLCAGVSLSHTFVQS